MWVDRGTSLIRNSPRPLDYMRHILSTAVEVWGQAHFRRKRQQPERGDTFKLYLQDKTWP